MSALIFKDLGEIHARLFDHRPMVLGEITYFIQEFETKRGQNEQHRLQRAMEYLRESNETLVDKTVEHLTTGLPQLTTQVNTGVEMCNKILAREDDPEKDGWFKEQHSQRLAHWSSFMDEMCGLSSEVDLKFKEESDKVEQQYKDLEAKLHVGEQQV